MRKKDKLRTICGLDNNWSRKLFLTFFCFERKKHITRRVIATLCALISVCILSTQNASATSIYLDDFEDLNHNDWDVTGGGVTGVKFVNESNWAYAYNAHGGKLSLSEEFEYQHNYTLSFEMQALARAGRGNYGETFHSASGVTISFENKFNVTLGEVSFVYATSSSLLTYNSYAISNTPDTFEALMSEWADIALVSQQNDISSIAIEFWAKGHGAQVPRGYAGPAEVRFDNVSIASESLTEPVPLPAAVWLFISALSFMGLAAHRK